MKNPKNVFGLILFFWLVSATIHGLALAGFALQERFPAVFALHLVSLVAMLASVLRMRKYINPQKPKTIFGLIREHFAPPMQIFILVFFIYTPINFFLFMSETQGGVASQEGDGRYILHNKGELIRELSEAEYLGLRANELRGFSGHWLLFIGFACASFYPGNPKSSES